mgnify:CR=1 FL=1
MSDIIERLGHIVGASHVLTADGDMAGYLSEPRDLYRGRALCVVRPGSTAEVAAVLKLCNDEGLRVTPQGGEMRHPALCGLLTTVASVKLGVSTRLKGLSTTGTVWSSDRIWCGGRGGLSASARPTKTLTFAIRKRCRTTGSMSSSGMFTKFCSLAG